MLKAIFAQVADTLRQRIPKLAALKGGVEEVFAYMAFAMEHWPQNVSINPSEPVTKENKRRSTTATSSPTIPSSFAWSPH